MVLRFARNVNCGGEAALKRGAYNCREPLMSLAGLWQLCSCELNFEDAALKGGATFGRWLCVR
jgi:hypothetical protein